jgi:hypothetical protein
MAAMLGQLAFHKIPKVSIALNATYIIIAL